MSAHFTTAEAYSASLLRDADALVRKRGNAARAYAAARAAECLYYCDDDGRAYWSMLEEIVPMRQAGPASRRLVHAA